jgi:hypothetical protein
MVRRLHKGAQNDSSHHTQGEWNMKHSIKVVAALSVKSGLKAGDGIHHANHNRRALSIKSGIKAGEGIHHANHNRRALAVKSSIKAGGFGGNHNRRILSVRSGIKAGGFGGNHNRRALSLAVKSTVKAGSGIHHANHSRLGI